MGSGWLRGAGSVGFGPVVLCVVSAACARPVQGPSPADDVNCAWRVCVRSEATPTQRIYRVRNREPVPATVTLTFTLLQNLRPSDSLPVERSVPAGDEMVLARLRVVDPRATRGARPVVTIDLGSDSTRHDSLAVYAFPFGGERPRPLVQGPGGLSHMDANRFGYDFAMPQGTPILAARRGIVVTLQDGFTEGGTRPELIGRANLVVVGHEDGTMASYGHLRPGLAVAVDDLVEVGTLLGWSGATGFAGRPHLHFHVGRRLTGGRGRTLPVRFMTDEQDRGVLVEGGLYGPGTPVGPGSR